MQGADVFVIAIHGKEGSGKNFFAERIFQWYATGRVTPLDQRIRTQLWKHPKFYEKALVFPLAAQLKAGLVADGLPVQDVLAEEKTKEMRDKLISTADQFRKNNDLYFCNAWYAHVRMLRAYNGVNVVIVPDLREKVELEFFRTHFSQFVLITVNAPQRNLEKLTREAGGDLAWAEKQARQKSETDLDSFTSYDRAEENGFIYIENDST